MNGKRSRRAKVPPRSTGRQAVQQSKQASRRASETNNCMPKKPRKRDDCKQQQQCHPRRRRRRHTLSLSHTRTAFERMMHTYKGRVMKKSVLPVDRCHAQPGGWMYQRHDPPYSFFAKVGTQLADVLTYFVRGLQAHTCVSRINPHHILQHFKYFRVGSSAATPQKAKRHFPKDQPTHKSLGRFSVLEQGHHLQQLVLRALLERKRREGVQASIVSGCNTPYPK